MLVLLSLSFSVSSGQTIITTLWADRGIITRDQLWNVSLVNATTTPFAARIELTVSDATSGVPLFSGLSKDIMLISGTNVLTAPTVYPVNYNRLSTSYNFNPSINSLLPPGIFNICYKVYKNISETVQVAGEECKSLESDPLTPPTLVIPENEQEINSARPLFTWLPPVPNSSLRLLNYTIRVVEKGPDQSAQEAVDRNLPLFNQSRLQQTSCNLPVNIPDLDTGKVYAWQVVAYNENSYVASSECWTFRLRTEVLPTKEKVASFFIPLIKFGSSQVINVQKELKITYNNEAADSLLFFQINKQVSANNSGEKENVSYPVELHPGINNITIDINALPSLKQNILYELYLLNSRQERWWINFRLNN